MSAPESNGDHRLKQAEKITTHPEQYKVCEGCGSIVASRAVTCPSCHSYLFDTTAMRVVAQAKDLAMRAAHSVLASDLL
jgi:recombinational DNA repair protein RecR